MTNYKYLALAILKQAAMDYQSALKKNDKSKIEYFEKWFVGEWAQLLGDDMGEIIVQVCKKRANEECVCCEKPKKTIVRHGLASQKRLITVNGKTKTVAEWAKETGMHTYTITDRLNKLGWSEQDAVTKRIGGKR